MFCSAQDPSRKGIEQENGDIDGHDGRADGGASDDGNEDAESRAEDGGDGGAEDDRAETFEYAHGGEGREDDQSGDQKGTDEVHRQNDDDGDDDGHNEVIEVYSCAGGLCEIFVEGNGKNFIVEQDEHGYDGDGQDCAKPDFELCEREDGGSAEEGRANVAGDIGGS